MASYVDAQTAIASLKLEIEYRSVANLKPHPRTPRKHPASQIRKLAAGIQAHGFVVPVLADQAGQVLAGHARLTAAKQIGLTTVPVIRLEHLSDAQARAFMVADNRLGELSSWDDQVLGEILLDLSLTNLDFSIEATGFDMGEIDLHINAMTVADASLRRMRPIRSRTPSASHRSASWVISGSWIDTVCCAAVPWRRVATAPCWAWTGRQ